MTIHRRLFRLPAPIIIGILLLSYVQVALPQETQDTTAAVAPESELDSKAVQKEKPLKRRHRGEVTLIRNIKEGDLVGAQIGLAGNIVGGDMAGLQLAGVYNLTEGVARGAQLAGLVNVAAKDAHAAQISGLANVSGGDAGVQLAGIANVGEGRAVAQISGVASIAGKSSLLAQIATVANVSGQSSAGQVAGVVNISGYSAWVQIGPINITPKAKLLQVGLINIAEEHKGIPIGLLNIVGGVPLRVGLTLDGMEQLTLSLRSGSRYVYSVVGLQGGQYTTWQTMTPLFAGIGVQLPLWRFSLAVEYARNQRPGASAEMVDIIGLRGSLRFNRDMGLAAGVAVPYNSLRNGNYGDYLARSWSLGFEWYFSTL